MTAFELWNDGKIGNFGSFHTALLELYRLADDYNKLRLEVAFPEWFAESADDLTIYTGWD